MSEEKQEAESSGPLADRLNAAFDPIFESKRASNLLIAVAVALIAILLFGIGFLLTNSITPEVLRDAVTSG